MKFRINREPLLGALQLASPFIPSMPMVKVLEFFSLQFTKSSLSIVGSSLTNAIRISNIPCSGAGPADVLVPARILTETVKALPANEELTIEVNSKTKCFSIHCSGRISANFNLATVSHSDYPKLSFEPPVYHTADVGQFLEGISSVQFSSGTDETRPGSCGVNIHHEHSKTRFVATDGQQLSFKQVERIDGLAEPITIHRKTVQDLIPVLEASTGDVEFGYSDSQFFLRSGNIEVFGPTIQERFPAYQSILTTYEQPTTITVDCAELIMSLKRMNGFSERVTHTVQIHANVDQQQVELISKDDHFQKSSVEVLSASITGQDIKFALNIKRLIDISGHIKTNMLKMSVKEYNKPVYVRPVNYENETSNDFLTMVAPQATY